MPPMGNKKRATIRFTPDNFKYLRSLAYENVSDINGEVNRIIAERRKADSKLTATPCESASVN
jgi:hypothetical protein